MSKFCIFCGEKPESKTKEHIIPKWLIKYTGNPKRKISVGYDMKRKELRTFSFDQLTFPACYQCNNDFSTLEDDVKDVILNLLEKNELDSSNSSILLDWLDKVRIGLWLLFYSLDGNPFDINPHFHIANRIGKFDRMLIVYKVNDFVADGINFIGTDTFAFQLQPSCFTLRLNNYYLFNVSKEFLFSRRIGFPFPEKVALVDDESDIMSMEFSKGIERVMLPLIRNNHFLRGIELYQPMIMNELDGFREFYNTDYVKANCVDFKKGIGKAFIYNLDLNKLETNISIDTSLKCLNYGFEEFRDLMVKQTYKYQNELLKVNDSIFENVLDETKQLWVEKVNAASQYNIEMIKLVDK